MRQILFCKSCQLYTLKELCPSCQQKSQIPKPARFSPEDRYGSYRRQAKKPELEQRGWL